MSYSVIHMQKIKMGGIRGIENHNERLKESHTNPDIDYDRSHLNKDLMEHDNRTYYMRVKDRIEELNLPKAVRKDAVVTTGFICTSDKAFFDGLSQAEQDKFFKVSHDFLKERYGEKNVIASKVHYDETTPHLHTYIVPVTEDGRLSAKDIFNPKELRSLQDDYHRTMNEYGFNLERGEGKNKHLSVQEYKIETKFAELKEKQAELEALEKVDKAVNLNAEKGKLMYNSQEVEAIKEQNKALKVENYKSKNEIQALNNKVERLENRLLKAENDLERVKPHVERLKDLEDENKELQSYVERKPELKKDLESFERQKKNAYDYGKAMSTAQDKWLTANEERRLSIDQTQKLEHGSKECQRGIDDLRNRQADINSSMSRLNDLQGQLNELQGKWLKGKDKKSLQEQIERENGTLKVHTDKLKADYNIEPSRIEDKISYLEDKKDEFDHAKLKQIDYTNQQEIAKTQALQNYKYLRSMADTQEPGFREISTRHSNRSNLPSHADKLFKVEKGDRVWILEQMQEKHPNNAIKCRELFDKQDQQEQAKALEKATKSISRTRDFGMER